jgi:hypothetical protein
MFKKDLSLVVLVCLVSCATVFGNGKQEQQVQVQKEVELTQLEKTSTRGTRIFIEGVNNLINTQDVIVMVFKDLPNGNNYPVISAMFRNYNFENNISWGLMHADQSRFFWTDNDKPWIRSGDFYIAFVEVNGRGDDREIKPFDEAFIYVGDINSPQRFKFEEKNPITDLYFFQHTEFKKYSEVK